MNEKNEGDSGDVTPGSASADLEALFRAQLEGVQVRSDEEVAEQRAYEMRQRVAQLRREAGLPVHATRFCREMEERYAARGETGNWWSSSGSPWGACLDRILEATINWATVVIMGPQGRGKTAMATAIARQFTSKARSVRYCEVIGLTVALQDAKIHGYQQKEHREWEAPDLLVIDQADKMPSVEWENRLIFRILDLRYNADKSTILLCNTVDGNPKKWAAEVSEKLGSSIWDRIRETGIVEVTAWDSLRPTLGEKGGEKGEAK